MILPDEFFESIGAARGSFTPPYPPRPRKMPPPLKTLRIFRENIIGVFRNGDFKAPMGHRKLLTQHIFLVNSPDLIRSALTAQHEAFQRKTPQMRHALEPLLGDGLFVSDGALWRLRRSVVNPIVHASQMAEFAPAMEETAVEWREAWRARPDDAPVNVLAEMGELTAEIISRAVFGSRLGREFTGRIVAGFADYQRRIDQVELTALLGLPDWAPRLRGPGVRRSLRRVHSVIDGIMDRFEAVRAAGEESGAMIGKLFDARDEAGRPLSRRAIRNEAIVTFMAGHETTANTLAWAWFLLSQCPRSRAKLHEEIDGILGGAPARLSDAPRLPFTRAVIEETLRLYPPVPILGRQAVATGRIGDRDVPKGSLVLVAPWLTHRNPTLWSRPDDFVPERFDPRIAPRPEKYAYIPFAIGPRICPGMTFGLTEAVICLATLAQDFAPEVASGHEVAPRCRLTLRPGDALPMLLRRRAPAPAHAA